MKIFVLKYSIVGILVALFLMGLTVILKGSHVGFAPYVHNVFEQACLLLWPTSILLMFVYGYQPWILIVVLLVILTNGLTYGLIGSVVWVGLRKNRLFILIFAVLIGIWCYFVLGPLIRQLFRP